MYDKCLTFCATCPLSHMNDVSPLDSCDSWLLNCKYFQICYRKYRSMPNLIHHRGNALKALWRLRIFIQNKITSQSSVSGSFVL